MRALRILGMGPRPSRCQGAFESWNYRVPCPAVDQALKFSQSTGLGASYLALPASTSAAGENGFAMPAVDGDDLSYPQRASQQACH